MTPLLFVDVETTGLDPDRHELWEVALIRRDDDGDVEYLWQLPVNLGWADPIALSIGKFYERHWTDSLNGNPLVINSGRSFADPPFQLLANPYGFAQAFAQATHGGVFIAANPTFDASFLGPFLRRYEACPGWHYRLVCIESMAVGYLNAADRGGDPLPIPWKGVSDLAERLGVPVAEETKHSALADARKVRDLYDRVMDS